MICSVSQLCILPFLSPFSRNHLERMRFSCAVWYSLGSFCQCNLLHSAVCHCQPRYCYIKGRNWWLGQNNLEWVSCVRVTQMMHSQTIGIITCQLHNAVIYGCTACRTTQPNATCWSTSNKYYWLLHIEASHWKTKHLWIAKHSLFYMRKYSSMSLLGALDTSCHYRVKDHRWYHYFDTQHMFKFSVTNRLHKCPCGVFSFTDLPCWPSDIHHFVKHESSVASHHFLVWIFSSSQQWKQSPSC